MRKKIIAKGNIRRGDFMRVVVTDTLPEEVPIIFSNDGFYLNLSKALIQNSDASSFVKKILTPEKTYTKPYRYNVIRDNFSARGLSLIHPSAQYDAAKFYQKYDTLICYFCSKSSASLRSPRKVGTTFFVKGPNSTKNRFKASPVDSVSIESSVSNPASYFSYNKISRAHQFFDSNDYMHLEKKFHIFRSLDVSKCFNSIYTHTLYWAVDNVQAAKDNTSSAGFANEFDRLMQSMNYNETNGICIGPEISRVFAEIIFSEIDKRVIEYASKRGIKYKDDFDFKRYVDDYYVFSHNESISDQITAAISLSLGQFNLHLNENKTVTISRPFSTKKSQVISDTNDALIFFFDKIIKSTKIDKVKIFTPKEIYHSDALLRLLIKKIKAICSLHSSHYEAISDYIVSALSKRVTDLCYAFEEPKFNNSGLEENYISIFLLLIESIYFFYTVNPTVRASLYVARAIIMATRCLKDHYPDRLPFLSENIIRWTIELTKSISRDERHKDLTAVPIEVLNILLPMKEIARQENIINNYLTKMCEDIDSFGYFEIVTFLFLLEGQKSHQIIIKKLFAKAKEIVNTGLGPRIDSQSAHLALDLLACPFLPLEKRASWFNILRSKCDLPKISREKAQAAVKQMASTYWFVRWDRVDLLALLRKKELSAIY
ncbi:antiviral reverse transcriptase Drt3b [Acetobacter oryzoeni]|uniref:RNA-directed DNA polymerase n=1 Tax=Acetobacter oryzoeni TaxID=2500548 RepID=A0A5B9GKV8_9PROT|nr:antiviral reverse transcriptase Drt3b [Acetobacter oryzoeni]MCP1203786.1 RNA-directed DNA polymerase [Acetobacter oryzoeni]QEE86901.1 RNA-directed DNA polymerase [Acetobacter oryzoeni]